MTKRNKSTGGDKKQQSQVVATRVVIMAQQRQQHNKNNLTATISDGAKQPVASENQQVAKKWQSTGGSI